MTNIYHNGKNIVLSLIPTISAEKGATDYRKKIRGAFLRGRIVIRDQSWTNPKAKSCFCEAMYSDPDRSRTSPGSILSDPAF